MIRSEIPRGARVAIVEDDPLLLESLAYFLRAKDCVVVKFGSAEDAAELGGRKDLDAVISDFLLPGEDGLSVLRRTRKECGDVVTVLITAHISPDLAVRARSAGVDRILIKPFSTKELEESLGALLGKRFVPNGDFLPATEWDGIERRRLPRHAT